MKRHPVTTIQNTIELLEKAALFAKSHGEKPTPYYRNRKDLVRLLKGYRRYLKERGLRK